MELPSIYDNPNKPVHSEWLNTEDAFPNFEFARKLKDQLGDEGTVFIYSPYETTTLKEIRRQMDCYGENDPDLADWLDWMTEDDNPRVVDLLELAKEFYVHPDMKGSLSIKDVLPAVWRHNPEWHDVGEYVGYLNQRTQDLRISLPMERRSSRMRRCDIRAMFGLTALDPKAQRIIANYFCNTASWIPLRWSLSGGIGSMRDVWAEPIRNPRELLETGPEDLENSSRHLVDDVREHFACWPLLEVSALGCRKRGVGLAAAIRLAQGNLRWPQGC